MTSPAPLTEAEKSAAEALARHENDEFRRDHGCHNGKHSDGTDCIYGDGKATAADYAEYARAVVAAVHDVITPKNPDWKPLTERHPEYFAPVSPEEAARKKGWGQGVELLTQRIKAALDGPTAAPEMPRPPAEETPPVSMAERSREVAMDRCPTCGGGINAWESCIGGVVMQTGTSCGGTCGSIWPEWTHPGMPVPAAQEPVSGPETPGTGSGRGTGVGGSHARPDAVETVARILVGTDWDDGVRITDIGSRETVARMAEQIVDTLLPVPSTEAD